MHYKKIIVAVELNSESDNILLKKAQEFAREGTELYVIHAVEYMNSYGAAYGTSAGINVESILIDEANQSLNALIKPFAVKAVYVKVGPAKFLILEEAEALQADLVIVGSHGRHGVRLLLGSTSNAILHSAKCDVLAVRIYDK